MASKPPILDRNRLTLKPDNSTTEPDFLGYTASSWLSLVASEGPVFRTRMPDDGDETYIICGHEADLAAWRAPEDWLYGPPSPGGDFFLAELGELHITQLDGEAHRRARRLILPAFGAAAVSRDLPVVAEVIHQGISGWRNREVDVHPVVSRLLARALAASQLKETLTDEEIEQLVTFEEAFIPAVSLSLPERNRWYATDRYRQAKACAFGIFERVVARRLAGERPGDSLDLIMDRPAPDELAPLSREELIRAAYLLLVAGVGNIANIVCAALWGLARHREWYERLKQECAGFDPLALRQGIGGYPVLKAVIQEVERRYLPAPVIQKRTARQLDLLGYSLPAGVNVLQLHGLAHFEEHRYPDAMRFDPSRWLTSQAERANAFGGGTHLCLGMGVTRLYVPLVLGLTARELGWRAGNPPCLVSQDDSVSFSPKTTHFPVSFDAV